MAFIKKIIKKNNVITISYEENGDDYTVKTTEQPRERFVVVLSWLRDILLRNLGIPLSGDASNDFKDGPYASVKGMTVEQERMHIEGQFIVIGLSHSYSEKKGDVYRIFGKLGDNTVKTSALTVPEEAEEFWKNHDKWKHPALLLPKEIDSINQFITEAEAFVEGARDQMELFDDNGEPTEEADNEDQEEN